MKKIPLTKGQEAIVDDWWYDYLSQWKWIAYWDNHSQSYYAVRHEGNNSGRKTIFMHRIVAKTPKGMLCDHIHHDTLDNRESQLRNVTNSQNTMNTKTRSDNALGIRGIHKRTDGGGYRVQLKFQGKKVVDRTLQTLDEAISIRKDAEKKYFGEFAYKKSS